MRKSAQGEIRAGLWRCEQVFDCVQVCVRVERCVCVALCMSWHDRGREIVRQRGWGSRKSAQRERRTGFCGREQVLECL